MTTGELLQVILMALLVVVTSIYAWRTFAISNATKKQAVASMKMAEEMKEQRYAESLPLLIPNFPPDTVATETFGKSLYPFLQSGEINVLWHNVGKGVSINPIFSLWGGILPSGEVRHFQAHESPALGGGQQILTSFDFYSTEKDKPERYQPRLEAEYQDIYERKITTVQEFHIDEEAKTAFLGELYFTVNGRRLGKEMTQND